MVNLLECKGHPWFVDYSPVRAFVDEWLRVSRSRAMIREELRPAHPPRGSSKPLLWKTVEVAGRPVLKIPPHGGCRHSR